MTGKRKRFEPRKRTALDGKNWFCIFDLYSMKYIPAYRFYRKKDAQYFINKKMEDC